MTPEQLSQLAPWFRPGERYLTGTPIDWSQVSYATMQTVTRVRERLDAPILLIRGPHPDPDGTKPYKATAVDLCAPEVELDQVAMLLFAMQRVSFGLYSGNSFHIDSRAYQGEPARWMAIKTAEEPHLFERGLQGLATTRADGWIYLSWWHPQAFQGLQLVLALARHNKAGGQIEV
jgi:hypothetical protein